MYLGRQRPTETTSSVLRSTYTGNGSTTTYALPGPVANETSIIATINGVTQQDAAYSTDGSNIIFDAAPALGDAIELRTLSGVAMSYAPSAGSVVTGVIADGAVTTDKIADSSITTAKIAAGAVVQADIGTNVAGTGPAFRAYLSSNQSISNSTNTKVQLNTKNFDTANCFDNTTNYRFTPNVAGYYQFSAVLALSGTNSGNVQALIYKNGATASNSVFYAPGLTGVTQINAVLSDLIYMNGSTDYVELYGYLSASSGNIFGGNSAQAYLAGYLARSA